MEKYKETLNDLTWPELLQQVAAVLARDEKALENNVNYYKKMLGDSNADKEKLNRLFDKLQLDKLLTCPF
jgi:predicted transcriptional regulator